MNTKLTWDHRKRQSNLLKHGLDFEHADEVLSSRFCLHLHISKLDEPRVISFSYVLSHLCVLALVHNQRHEQIRLISFRKASKEETIAYFRWLEHERIDPTWSARKNTSNQPRQFLCLEWSWSRRPTTHPRTISAIGVRSTLIWLDHHFAPLNGAAYGIVNASPKLKCEGSAGEFIVVQSGRNIAIEFDGHQRAKLEVKRVLRMSNRRFIESLLDRFSQFHWAWNCKFVIQGVLLGLSIRSVPLAQSMSFSACILTLP